MIRAPSNLLPEIRRRIVATNPQLHWVIDNLAFLHVGGSTLYGTQSPDSDLDIRGVTIAPKSYWVGARSFEQTELTIPELNIEVVIFDIRKWLRLTVAVNPNVLETLFVDDESEFTLLTTDRWRFIRQEARALMNRRAYAGYHGYTTSQLKKLVVKHGNKTGRRELAEEYGFDLKFAMHGFRLAAQGAELLRTGRIVFPRPDREHLRAIRFSKVYGRDDMDRCVADLTAATEQLACALAESPLPETADFERYDRLLISIYERFVAPGEASGTPAS